MSVPINLRLMLPTLLPLRLPCQGPLGHVLSLFGLDVATARAPYSAVRGCQAALPEGG
jgi:hypothetical protein